MRAAPSARSRSRRMKLCTCFSCRSMRARQASVRATGERRPAAMAIPASAIEGMSVMLASSGQAWIENDGWFGTPRAFATGAHAGGHRLNVAIDGMQLALLLLAQRQPARTHERVEVF